MHFHSSTKKPCIQCVLVSLATISTARLIITSANLTMEPTHSAFPTPTQKNQVNNSWSTSDLSDTNTNKPGNVVAYISESSGPYHQDESIVYCLWVKKICFILSTIGRLYFEYFVSYCCSHMSVWLLLLVIVVFTNGNDGRSCLNGLSGHQFTCGDVFIYNSGLQIEGVMA